jgi:hypothetical protein
MRRLDSDQSSERKAIVVPSDREFSVQRRKACVRRCALTLRRGPRQVGGMGVKRLHETYSAF